MIKPIFKKTKIFSYVLRIDDGAAPNPFWGMCTLTICKPVIRRTTEIGDWVIGTGSKHAKCNDGNEYDYTDKLVYAMKISEIMSLQEYNEFCISSLPNRIPQWDSTDWLLRIGDCIYDYSQGDEPVQRKSVHNENNRKRDLSGLNALLSRNYYYFGERPVLLPDDLKPIVKRNQGHKKIENEELISKFEKWIIKFDKNRIYADPQIRFMFDNDPGCEYISGCDSGYENEDDEEEILC